jgi:hypothetical protein
MIEQHASRYAALLGDGPHAVKIAALVNALHAQKVRLNPSFGVKS